ncbi:MAG: hypothetical protein IPJ43_00095 [Saprospiraceae bacterium]|nr:hypothetical protein [Saprospiraceae bacterium]
MKKLSFLLLVSLLSIVISCKDGSGGKKSSSTTSIMSKYAPLPGHLITEYNKTATSIDLISLRKEVNVSMSFDNPQAVQYVISFIGDEPGNVTNQCKPDGHIVLFNNGEVVNEADIYFSDGCNAIVWMQNQKPTNCNSLSNEGVDFYKNFLKSRATSVDSTGTKQ